MASLSNFPAPQGSNQGSNRDNPTLSECTCPICMYILIEPVTLPCNHTLCMPCFQQNVQEVNLCCPLCRLRISAWARRATKDKSLVDQSRWKQIKEAFPQKVKNRMEGKEDSDSEEGEYPFPSGWRLVFTMHEHLGFLSKLTEKGLQSIWPRIFLTRVPAI